MVSKCCPSPLRSSTCFFLKPQGRSFVAIEEQGGQLGYPCLHHQRPVVHPTSHIREVLGAQTP